MAMPLPHFFPVQVYYEDTDHSGLVYHANYLKFFERAREHLLGVDVLIRLHRGEGIGFVVHDLSVTFRAGARFGEQLVVRSEAAALGPYRLRMHQDVLRDGKPIVLGRLDLVCVGPRGKLVPLPEFVVHRFAPPDSAVP
jgi:tol-pal system-associated acyl-CoA thioesterase